MKVSIREHGGRRRYGGGLVVVGCVGQRWVFEAASFRSGVLTYAQRLT